MMNTIVSDATSSEASAKEAPVKVNEADGRNETGDFPLN